MGRQIFRSIIKRVKSSPSKANLVLRELRGKSYPDALLLLKFLPYAICYPLKKALRSAATEAAGRFSSPEKHLYIKLAFANYGQTKEKLRPKSRGKVDILKVVTSHIMIEISKFD